MTRKLYEEGDWFAVPTISGYVLGRIARVGKRGGILLGYFFEPLRTSPPNLQDTFTLVPNDAFNISKFGDRGLVEDGWPIIYDPSCWDRDEWPMPAFGRIDSFNPERGYCVQYDEDDLSVCLRESLITAEQALQLPEEGLAGHILLQRRLEKYPKEGQRPYDPKNRQRSYFWYHGLPKIEIA